MKPQDVTAIVITRGDLPDLMTERMDQFQRLGMSSIIYHSSDVMGRYTAAKHAKTDVVFFQDDDVALSDEEILKIIEHYKPGVLVSNMYDEWIEAMHYEDLAMVGLGSVVDKGLWEDAFERYAEAYPDDIEEMKWDPDFIFGTLCRFERYDFCGERIVEAILPEASNDNRLWKKPGQHERKYATIDKARALRTIVLTMLTKNEEHRVLDALESAKGLFDKVLIHDSGSTDETRSVIEKWCWKNGISEFRFIDTEWQGFAAARNALLEDGRKMADYMLLMDADETFERKNPDTTWPPLQMDIHVMHYGGKYDVGQPRLIRSNFPCWFEGSTHAAMTWHQQARGVDVTDPIIEHHGDFTHGDGDVYDRLRRDVEALTHDIETDPDPQAVAHQMFMRAKTYEGLGEWGNARADYEARLAFNDEGIDGMPAEQRFYARYRLGVMLIEHFNEFAEGCDALMTAWMERPKRVESIRALAYYLTVVADETPYPANEILLVDRDMYKQPQGG